MEQKIIRNPFGISHAQQAAELYGGDDFTRLKRRYAIEHFRAITLWMEEIGEKVVGVETTFRKETDRGGRDGTIWEFHSVITHE